MKCKIFSGDLGEVEKKINKFIKDKEIVSIAQSTLEEANVKTYPYHDVVVAITVLYK